MQAAADDLALATRAGDYDRFLAIQLAPAPKRPALYAVTAFHIELSRIAESVSEALIGHIRLAWWREALEEIMAGASPRNHPNVLALAELYKKSPEVFPFLLKMVEARAADLDESLMTEEEAWLAYLDGTAGALHHAWALILDPALAVEHFDAITSEARGYAMVGLARAIPYLAQQNFIRFPRARIEKYALVALAPSPELFAFVNGLLDDAHLLLTHHAWPKKLLPLAGLARLAKLQLRFIRKFECNPYRPSNIKLAAVLRIIQMKFLLC